MFLKWRGQSLRTFNGDWFYAKVTGRYAKYTGSDTYTGYVPSPNKVYIELTGQMQAR
jgi:hypothetical protein